MPRYAAQLKVLSGGVLLILLLLKNYGDIGYPFFLCTDTYENVLVEAVFSNELCFSPLPYECTVTVG